MVTLPLSNYLTRSVAYLPKVELGTRSDIQEIENVVCGAFSCRDTFIDPKYPRISADEIKKTFQIGNKWFVIRTDDHLKKIVAAVLYVSDHVREASIHLLSSLPEYQGKGYGLHLVYACVEQAILEKKEKLRAQVTSLKDRLLSKGPLFGFQEEGVEPFFQPVLKEEWQGKREDGDYKVSVINLFKPLDKMSEDSLIPLIWKIASETFNCKSNNFQLAKSIFNNYRYFLFTQEVQYHRTGVKFREFGTGPSVT